MADLKGPRRRVVTLRVPRPIFYILKQHADALDMSIPDFLDRFFYQWCLAGCPKSEGGNTK